MNSKIISKSASLYPWGNLTCFICSLPSSSLSKLAMNGCHLINEKIVFEKKMQVFTGSNYELWNKKTNGKFILYIILSKSFKCVLVFINCAYGHIKNQCA